MAHPRFSDIGACVFDAYGTLFDYNTAAAAHAATLGDKAAQLSDVWRMKQLQYTWLRSLMGKHAPFWQVTGEALDYAMAAVGVEDADLRGKLMDAYLTLDAYPEVLDMLRTLKKNNVKAVILSNGEPRMLKAAVEGAGLADVLEPSLSVEEVGIYKPHVSVYQLAVDRLDLTPERIAFMSSNSWDAVGAASFGFRVAWCNRFGQGREHLPAQPDVEIKTLAELPPLLGLA